MRLAHDIWHRAKARYEAGGVFFFATFALAMLGLLVVVVRRRHDGWWRFIVYGLAVSILPAGADSALVDLLNQLRAQFGKHITAAAAAELQALATLLKDCYETVVPTCSTVPGVVALRTS